MNKIIENEVKIIQRKHQYYCDLCGCFLGESVEFDDGYVEPLSDVQEIDLSINICGTWCKYRKQLCLNCKNAEIDTIVAGLKSLGFEEKI